MLSIGKIATAPTAGLYYVEQVAQASRTTTPARARCLAFGLVRARPRLVSAERLARWASCGC